jgi:hypothetical protein
MGWRWAATRSERLSRGDSPVLADDAAGDFHDGEELKGFDATDAFEATKVVFLPRDQAGEGSGVGDEARGEREDVVPACAAAKEHGEEFAVAESGGAEALESLLRAVAGGRFAQAVADGIFRQAGHEKFFGHARR